MTPVLLSQRDPRWASVILGTSSKTIGQVGCTITCIAMKFGLTPDMVNQKINAVDGYAAENPNDPYNPEKDLVNWTKLAQALPGVQFVFKYATYINDVVKENIPCLVEVNAAPIGGTRHWVLYIGNQRLYDPWDGQEKSTDTYEPLSFVILSGEYKEDQPVQPQQTTQDTYYYKGLNLSDKESMMAAVDAWKDVIDGNYIKKADYDAIVTKNTQLEEQIKNTPKQSEVDQDIVNKYNAFVALGYTSVDDIQRKLKEENDKNVKLLQDLVVIEKRNENLANTIAQDSKNSYTAVEAALAELDQVKNLQESMVQIAQVTGADKPTVNSIVSRIFFFKDLAEKFIQEKEAKSTKPQKVKKKKGKSSVSITTLISSSLNRLAQALSLQAEEVTK